ncbi:MAG: dihydrofolate reductase [Bacteroidales bacterium]|nr:dihydrofolate reductase [Bacteroidales bacterium]
MENRKEFTYFAEQFADIRILRYKVSGFEQLTPNQRILLFFLSKAAHSGRDILWDQNYKHNLAIRKTLEAIVKSYNGDRNSDEFKQFMVYTKRVWFSNGIHHHNSMDKIMPDFTASYFKELVQNSDWDEFPESFYNELELFKALIPAIFDPEVDAKRVSLDSKHDIVENSACNFYEDVSQKEAEEFYAAMGDPNEKEPPSYGLNSKLVKEGGIVKERVWKVGGMYSSAIVKVVFWLEKALDVAENETQKAAFEKLIEYYKTGDLKTFDEYNKLWLQDTNSIVDVINGFIEVYGDPLGRKATFESVVSIVDVEASKRAKTISDHALWFEQHSTTDARFKKNEIKGISAKVVNVVNESGDCSPATPIGINLPNADWMRASYGSKSVTINNILEAYDAVSRETGVLEEFAWDEKEVKWAKEHGTLCMSLHVDLHEIVGHGSGKIIDGVGDPADTLKNYASTIEEARADLVALYYAIDPELVKLGLMPSLDTGYSEYNSYIRGGLLTQLVRVELGKDLEESHMRNRQLIAKWAFEKGIPEQIIEKKTKDGKSYFVINDYEKLRIVFGDLLREIQRIKSEGDFEAAKSLVEDYGVKIDRDIHQEVLERWAKLNIAPYSGFINPIVKAIEKGGQIVDAQIEYPNDFSQQMLYYSTNYSLLPEYN